MNWYKGTIAEAVTLSKQRNAVFVVYLEKSGDDPSNKLRGFLEDDRIKSKLESDNFVAIRVEGDSDSYLQFARIYQIVPLPSLFFIGQNGSPLEIATGIIQSVEELEKKILNVLSASGLGGSVSASADFINSEKAATTPKVTAATSENKPTTSAQTENCSDGVCYLKPKDQPTETKELDTVTSSEQTPEVSSQEMLERARKILEEKRKERVEEEARLAREQEIQRRKDMKDLQTFKDQQKQLELKELRDNIRREKLEEDAARQRIREKIEGDKKEREAQKLAAANKVVTPNPVPVNTTKPTDNLDSSKIQFRIPSGETHAHTFKSFDQFSVVREYVQSTVLLGTGITNFTLVTTFPRKEFTVEDEIKTLLELGLCPSGVILVVTKAGTAANVIAKSGGLVNVFNTVFWGLLAPFISVFGYLKMFIFGRGDNGSGDNSSASTGAQKRANEEQVSANDLAKKRNLDKFVGRGTSVNDTGNRNNLDRFLGKGATDEMQKSSSRSSNDNQSPSTSASGTGAYRRLGGSSNVHRLADQKDSDDENATWNGNSTQQQ